MFLGRKMKNIHLDISLTCKYLYSTKIFICIHVYTYAICGDLLQFPHTITVEVPLTATFLNSKIFLHENMLWYWPYSSEMPHWGTSDEYPQHTFSRRNKKNIKFSVVKKNQKKNNNKKQKKKHLIWRYEPFPDPAEVIPYYNVPTSYSP